MKLIEELIMEKEEANVERLKERYIYTNIVNGYTKEFPGDASIQDVFKQREELRRIASSNSKWELISDGFVTRSNFGFDEKTKEITYDRHYIVKMGGKYVPDSQVSFDYLEKHIGDFTALSKVEEIIDRYQVRYPEPPRRHRVAFQVDNKTLEDKTSVAEGYTNMYLRNYGEIGKKLLIKWLNRLNQDIDLETLLIEFKSDISSAKLYLDTPENKSYQAAKASHMDLDFVLLRLLETYSTKGAFFSSKYKQSIEEQYKRTV